MSTLSSVARRIRIRKKNNNAAIHKQSVLNMTNEDIIKEFVIFHAKFANLFHGEEAIEQGPLCFEDFDFDGWRKYMFERGNKDPVEAIDASYCNHSEFHEENEVYRINWEGEMPCDEGEESDED